MSSGNVADFVDEDTSEFFDAQTLHQGPTKDNVIHLAA